MQKCNGLESTKGSSYITTN
uniref:Uncharacterized protein n=1 Tax=Anguilla anguilla TaxID=7936 RepID=A0A0E9SRU1_ANGAN